MSVTTPLYSQMLTNLSKHINETNLQVARMSQDCTTSFHLTAHILHRGLLSVWEEHMLSYCPQAETDN